MASGFCPRCGETRVGAFRFCRKCGLDFDSPEAAAPPALLVTPPRPSPGGSDARGADASATKQVETAGGVAWIICALFTGYLALVQFGIASTLGSLDRGVVGSLNLDAIFNGLAAALTVYFGARLLLSPPRGFLGTSTVWGVLDVIWGTYQIANGASHWAFYGSVVAAAAAGILSFVAYSQRPKPVAQPMVWPGQAAPSAPETVATPTTEHAAPAASYSERYAGTPFGAPSATNIDLATTAPANGRRTWAILGVVIFVAVVAAAGVLALAGSGSLSPRHTVSGTFGLLDSDASFPSITTSGSGCQGTGGYADISPGAQVTLKDGDGKILGTTQLSTGSGTTTACLFTFAIPNVPEVAFYSVEISHRGQVTNSLADLKSSGWTFSLTLGN